MKSHVYIGPVNVNRAECINFNRIYVCAVCSSSMIHSRVCFRILKQYKSVFKHKYQMSLKRQYSIFIIEMMIIENVRNKLIHDELVVVSGDDTEVGEEMYFQPNQ